MMTPIGTAVAARLATARQSRDHSTLLTAEAAADALALLREAAPSPGNEVDTAALADVCLTFYLRGQIGGPGQAAGGPVTPELVIAFLVGGLLFGRAPQLLPEPVRNHLASVSDPLREARFAYVAAAAHAGIAVPGGEAPGDLRVLDRALAWSSACCQVMVERGDAAEAADALVQRITLLSARFRLAGDLGALEEAGKAGMRVVERLPSAHPARAAYLPTAVEAVVRSAYCLGSPSGDEAERAVAALPPGTATEATTQMLSALRAIRSQSGSTTWAGELDLRVGLEFDQEGMRTGHPGLLAVAERRLRAALSRTPPGHPVHHQIKFMIGATLLRLGEHREEIGLVQEGVTLLGQSGLFFRGLARLDGSDVPAATAPAAAVVDILFRAQPGGTLNWAAAITDEWLSEFAAAVGQLPVQHPQREVYTTLLAAVRKDKGSDPFAVMAAAAAIDWARLAAELRETGRALPLAAVFESVPRSMSGFAAMRTILDDPSSDVGVEQISAVLASDASADGTDRRAGRSAVLGSLLSVITDPVQATDWDQETRLAAAALLADVPPPATVTSETAAGQQGTEGKPDVEEMLTALGEYILAATMLAEDSEASQLDRLEDIGQRISAMASQLNPELGEQIKVITEAGLAGATELVRTTEAIPQGRAAESRAERIATIRRRIDELPEGHLARGLLEAQLVLSLAGLAADLRDSDPGRARELLAEATALADSEPLHPPGPSAAILRQALDYGRALVEHTESARILGVRSEKAHDRLRRAGDDPKALRQVLADPEVPVWQRVLHGFATAFKVTADRRLEQGMACAEQAVDLLAQMTDRGTDTASAEHAISLVSTMPSTYVSGVLTMLHATRKRRTLTGPLVDRAAAMAERSRGLLLARQLEGRTDLGELRSAHPELASQFEALTAQLAADPDALAALRADENPPVTGRAEWARLVKFRASRDLDALVEQVRAEDKVFRDFLRPLKPDQLRDLAAEGPVVLFNYPSLSQQQPGIPPVLPFALVVTGRTITSVCLPVQPVEVAEAAGRWSAAVADINARGPERPGPRRLREAAADMADILSWTWHKVVGPVLHAAGLPRGREWPRIWWIPDGPFHALPLHAAQCPAAGCELGGPDRIGCGGAALDAVVSSYVPGFRTLAHARRRGADPSATDAGRPLLVATGDDELPDAEAAAREAAARLGAAAPLVGRDATRDVVVRALKNVSYAHFGCHAASDPAAPSGGVLHLPSGEPLTVREICQARPLAARLAFLTACSTARTSQRLASEAIHLSSAFLIAGFGEAVGTLWEIDSRDAYRVTTEFYQLITGQPPQGAAVALHHCVRVLRHERPDAPHIWAAYVHAGA
jgi:hypothetical protein